MFEQTGDGGGRVDAGIAGVEAKLVIKLLDSGVQRPAVLAERHRKEELLLGRIAQQEGSLGFPIEELFRLVPVHFAPVEAAAGDFLEIWDETVDKVDLRVNPRHVLGVDQMLVLEHEASLEKAQCRGSVRRTDECNLVGLGHTGTADGAEGRSSGKCSAGHEGAGGEVGRCVDSLADLQLALQPCPFVTVLQGELVAAVEPRDVKHSGAGNNDNRVAPVMSPGSQAPVQRLGRAAIDPVDDGRRGRSRMMMPVVISREQECMVLLRLLITSSASSGTTSTAGLQMVMVVVQRGSGCRGRMVMGHQRQRARGHRVAVAGGDCRNVVHFAVRRANA